MRQTPKRPRIGWTGTQDPVQIPLDPELRFWTPQGTGGYGGVRGGWLSDQLLSGGSLLAPPSPATITPFHTYCPGGAGSPCVAHAAYADHSSGSPLRHEAAPPASGHHCAAVERCAALAIHCASRNRSHALAIPGATRDPSHPARSQRPAVGARDNSLALPIPGATRDPWPPPTSCAQRSVREITPRLLLYLAPPAIHAPPPAAG